FPLLGFGDRGDAYDGASGPSRNGCARAIRIPRASDPLSMNDDSPRPMIAAGPPQGDHCAPPGGPEAAQHPAVGVVQFHQGLETGAAWLLGVLWLLPLVYAGWTAFHPPEFSTRFDALAPLTLENFAKAWAAAPFARYFVNTTLLVTMVLAAQLVL